MKKILLVFGTRPEAIKMAPLVKELQKRDNLFETKVCVTAQHREMLDQVLDFFGITPDFDLNLMRPNQNLYSLTGDIINGLKPVLEAFAPDVVLVHGDTTTSTAAALAAFYSGAKVGHVEAGLRTYNKVSPFPEEINRQITSKIADLHFAPTIQSKENLLKENIDKSTIWVTGNTVIDALLESVEIVNHTNDNEYINRLESIIDQTKKIILVTGHRRENHGEGFLHICKALNEIGNRGDVQIIYPVHLNPNVQKPVYDILGNNENIKLIDPLPYEAFVWLMDKSYIIVTDSGGVQEEAPSLGKPVLVMRNTTERPEAVEAGTVLLVGANSEKIISTSNQLLDDNSFYNRMSQLHNPYGDGKAATRIVESLMNTSV